MSPILVLSLIIILITFILLIFQTVRGEQILYRVLALDLIGITSIGLFVIFYISTRNSLFLDLAMIVTFVSFVTAIVFSTFLPQPNKEER